MNAGVRTSPRRKLSCPHLAGPLDFPGTNFMCRRLWRQWRQKQHCITITEKPILIFDSMAIRIKDTFPTGKSCDEHH
jgi:hypothetical protein